MYRKKLKRGIQKQQRDAEKARLQDAVLHVRKAVTGVHRHHWAWGFIIGLSSLALSAYNPALAQNGRSQEGEERFSRQPIDIPSGDLPSALTTWSRHVGLLLLYPSELIAGLQTQGVQGMYTPEEALRVLLADTGLQYRFADAKTVTLQFGSKPKAPNGKHSDLNRKDDDTVIQAVPIVIEETITRSKVFLPPVDGYKADQTTSTTRTALPINETPSSIGVVTRDLIRNTLSRSQSDAFEHVSGVSRANLSYGRSELFNIRGFRMGGNAGAILQNGLRSDSLFAPDPAFIERYEIIKGPASIAGGASNPGGIVNRITKRPKDGNFATSQFQAGSYDFYRGVVDANGVLPQYKNVRGRLIFAVEDGGNFVDDVDVRQYTIAPSIEVDLFGGAGALLLTGHYQKFDGSSYFGIPLLADGEIPDIPRSRNIGGGSDNGAKLDFEGQNYELHYNHAFVNDLTLSVKGKYSNTDFSDKTLYAISFPEIPANGDTLILAGLHTFDLDTYAGEIFLSKGFQALGQKHEVLVGVDHRDQNHDFSYGYVILGPDNIFNPANNFPIPSDDVLEAAATPRTTNIQQTGLFGQVVVRPFPRLTLVGAGRYDWADATNTNPRTNVSQNETYSEFTGRIGATYELVHGLNVYAGYAQSFQVNFNNPTVDGSLLPPETGENYEVGVKLDLLDSRLRLTTALFRTYRQNVATQDPNNQNFSIAVGEQRHQGVEFDVNGQPWPGLNLSGNFSYIDAEITEDNTAANVGNTPTQVPRSYVGRIFATYELQSGTFRGLGFGGGIFFQSGFELELPNKTRTDAYERVDAVVFYRPPQKAYDFTINVRNLLDATYIESPGNGTSGYNSFGAPVSVFGTLRVNFSPDLDWKLW